MRSSIHDRDLWAVIETCGLIIFGLVNLTNMCIHVYHQSNQSCLVCRSPCQMRLVVTIRDVKQQNIPNASLMSCMTGTVDDNLVAITT